VSLSNKTASIIGERVQRGLGKAGLEESLKFGAEIRSVKARFQGVGWKSTYHVTW